MALCLMLPTRYVNRDEICFLFFDSGISYVARMNDCYVSSATDGILVRTCYSSVQLTYLLYFIFYYVTLLYIIDIYVH